VRALGAGLVAVGVLAAAVPAGAATRPTKPCRDDPEARCGSIRVPLVRGVPDAGDALARWVLMYGARGHGLRGGGFVASGDYYSFEPVGLRLRRARFVSDLGVSGTLTWDRRALRVRGRLRLSGAHTGMLSISWPTRAARAEASLRGTLGGRPVRLRTPAP
jgi:hypothetical protein